MLRPPLADFPASAARSIALGSSRLPATPFPARNACVLCVRCRRVRRKSAQAHADRWHDGERVGLVGAELRAVAAAAVALLCGPRGRAVLRLHPPAQPGGTVALAFRDDALEAALADGGEQRLPEGRVLFVTPERRSPHEPAIEALGHEILNRDDRKQAKSQSYRRSDTYCDAITPEVRNVPTPAETRAFPAQSCLGAASLHTWSRPCEPHPSRLGSSTCDVPPSTTASSSRRLLDSDVCNLLPLRRRRKTPVSPAQRPPPRPRPEMPRLIREARLTGRAPAPFARAPAQARCRRSRGHRCPSRGRGCFAACARRRRPSPRGSSGSGRVAHLDEDAREFRSQAMLACISSR